MSQFLLAHTLIEPVQHWPINFKDFWFRKLTGSPAPQTILLLMSQVSLAQTLSGPVRHRPNIVNDCLVWKLTGSLVSQTNLTHNAIGWAYILKHNKREIEDMYICKVVPYGTFFMFNPNTKYTSDKLLQYSQFTLNFFIIALRCKVLDCLLG